MNQKLIRVPLHPSQEKGRFRPLQEWAIRFFLYSEATLLAIDERSHRGNPWADLYMERLFQGKCDKYKIGGVGKVAVLKGSDNTASVLKDAGLTEKGLVLAIKDLRKGSTVNSQSGGEQYNSLQKFSKNLNELARAGKLDPVIGRDEEIRRTLHILTRRSKNNPILVGEPGVGKTAIVEWT